MPTMPKATGMTPDQSLHLAMHEAMSTEAARRQIVEQLEDVPLSRNAYRLACAADDVPLEGPGLRVAVDIGQVRLRHRQPTRPRAVDECPRGLRRIFGGYNTGHGRCESKRCEHYGSGFHGA